MLQDEKYHDDRGQFLPAFESQRSNQGNRRQQRRGVARVLILKQQQAHPAARNPKHDRRPALIKNLSQQNDACDEGKKQGQEQLIAFERA